MRLYRHVESPIGRIMLTSDGESLTGLYLDGQKHEPQPSGDWTPDDSLPLFTTAAAQLAEYFAGTRTSFELRLALVGTPFQEQVWRRLQGIPYGTQASYSELARALGKPQAARAVGGAVGRNPVSIIVPCHRVVGTDGALTGYAGGIERKKALLELEATRVQTLFCQRGSGGKGRLKGSRGGALIHRLEPGSPSGSP